MILDSLTGMVHQVRTTHGRSEKYKSTEEDTLFGSGQGSGASPTAWNVIDEVLLHTMDQTGYGIQLSNPDGSVTNERNEDAFVDDAALGVTDTENIPLALQKKTQQHEEALYATGGQLALHKCTWVLIQWAWNEGIGHLKTTLPDDGGRCTDSSPNKINIHQTASNTITTIPQLHPSTGYRTLGIWIAADGNELKQIAILRDKVREWTHLVQHCSLTAKEKQMAYFRFLKPQLGYPLPCLKIPRKVLRSLHRPALTLIMHTLHLNRNFPQELIYGSSRFFGLGMEDI